MRLPATIIGLLLLGQLSCSPDDADTFPPVDDASISPYFTDDLSISTLNGTWRVYCYENFTTHTLEFKTHENSGGQDIIVEFDDTTDPNLFSGIKTSNSFSGEFDYVSSREFKLKGVISTLAGQPKWADEFDNVIFDGLYGDVTFTINDEMLCIRYFYNTKSVTLLKQ